MSTSFPTSLDSLTNPNSGDYMDVVDHAAQHANANDAVEALEAKVGVDSSAVTTSHDYKLSGVTGSDKASSLAGSETLTNKTLSTGSTIDANVTVTEVLKKAYPVGSIYINATDATNPATLLGFGTWSAFGAGRVMVGLDSGDVDFDTAEETGGHKEMQQHNHSVTDPGHDHSVVDRALTAAAGTARYQATGSTTTGSSTTGLTVDNEGTGDSGNLQPYIVVYFWKRTA